jgi:hypothetical protein
LNTARFGKKNSHNPHTASANGYYFNSKIIFQNKMTAQNIHPM